MADHTTINANTHEISSVIATAKTSKAEQLSFELCTYWKKKRRTLKDVLADI